MSYEANTAHATRIHLTLTGVNAGVPLCGCDKAGELADGAVFWHAIYAPDKTFTDPRLCPVCKQIWDSAGTE